MGGGTEGFKQCDEPTAQPPADQSTGDVDVNAENAAVDGDVNVGGGDEQGDGDTTAGDGEASTGDAGSDNTEVEGASAGDPEND